VYYMRRHLLRFVGTVVCLASTFFAIQIPAVAAVVSEAVGSGDLDKSLDSPMSPGFDLQNITVAFDSEDADVIYVWLELDKKPSTAMFRNYRNSFMGVLFDSNLDGAADYGLWTDNSIYSAFGDAHNLSLFDNVKNQDVANCTATSWMGTTVDATWIGFSIPKSCMPLGSTVGIKGYSYDGYDGDLVPSYNQFDRFSTNMRFSPKDAVLAQVVTAPEGVIYRTLNPSQAPEDLVLIAKRVAQSVVTVYCADGLGTGFSLSVDLSKDQIANRYESLLITNHHVIESCIGSGEVDIVDSKGSTYKGWISADDSTNDLAGILIKAKVPALSWRGETPEQGWWAAALGSPLGVAGYLTTGIISRNDLNSGQFNISVALNPGNSGGPVFDRNGRVIGVAVAKFTNSEGMGLAVAATRLCDTIASCTPGSMVWSSNLANPPSSSTTDAIGWVVNRTLPRFSGGLKTIDSGQKLSVRSYLTQYSDAKKFICTGTVLAGSSQADYVVARTRAKAVCEYAKALNPTLSYWYQTKVTAATSYKDRVLITIKG
jgi:hypothetical protein